ncbi:MAG: fasciclin domain-containing protein [Rhodobacterales bacterium]
MKQTFKALLLATSLSAASTAMAANPQVGGADMFETRNIVENAVNSADHTTLVAAVQAAELVETLQGPGPFTVFAPVNAAFEALPAGTVETLLMPENKAMLQKVLTAHVVAGNLSTAQIAARARASSDGFYHMNTVSGDALSAQVKGRNLFILDESGNAARVTISDVMQSNGVIHVVNSVLVPK